MSATMSATLWFEGGRIMGRFGDGEPVVLADETRVFDIEAEDVVNERLVKLFREEFYAAVGLRDTWETAELRQEFERSLANAAVRLLDTKEEA